jgi:hypothetical protein
MARIDQSPRRQAETLIQQNLEWTDTYGLPQVFCIWPVQAGCQDHFQTLLRHISDSPTVSVESKFVETMTSMIKTSFIFITVSLR